MYSICSEGKGRQIDNYIRNRMHMLISFCCVCGTNISRISLKQFAICTVRTAHSLILWNRKYGH